MWQRGLAAGLIACVATLSRAGITGTITPASSTFSGAPGDCFEEPLVGDIVIPEPPTDILFLLDVTGSGAPATELGDGAFGLYADMTSILGDAQAGAAWHQDFDTTPNATCGYTDFYGETGDVPWMPYLAITPSAFAFSSVRDMPRQGGGGDPPESQAWALDRAIHDPAVGWRPGVRHVVLLFTDELPHVCNPGACMGIDLMTSGSDPGADGQVGTADDLDILDVVDEMAAQGMILLVADLSNGVVDPSRGMSVADLWNCWAGRTGGFAEIVRPLVRGNEPLVDVVRRMLNRLHDQCASVSIAAAPGDEAWVDSATPVHPAIIHSASRDFDARYCIPAGTPDGTHDIAVRLLCGDDPLASHSVRITVRDCGCTAGAPTLTAGTLTQECFTDAASAQAAALAATTVGGGCRVPPDLVTTLDGGCEAVVRIRAVHECGEADVSYDVRVDPDPPQLLGVPADVTADCSAVPPPAAPTARDDCDPSPELSFTESVVAGDCPGRYTIRRTWTATDSCGLATVARQVVTVVDTTPPVFEPDAVTSYCLWPPAHRMVTFAQDDFLPRISDDCSEPIAWRLAGCESSQADDGLGDGHTVRDCAVSADGTSVAVRAERTGLDEAGRTYRILATATDACGNTSAPSLVGLVHVPHDQRAHPPCERSR